LVYDSIDKIWRIFENDLRTRVRIITSDVTLMPNEHISVFGADNNTVKTINVTLPTDVAVGDTVKIAMNYMRKGQTVVIKASDGDTIASNLNLLQFPKRSEYPPDAAWVQSSSITFNGTTSYVPVLELAYIEEKATGKSYWIVTESDPTVERVDAKESVLELVEKLDMFLEMRMDEEFEELRDDLHEAKRNNLGKKVFEAFKQEFASIINEDEQQASDELEIMREQLEDMKAELQVARNNVLKEERKAKMASLLSNLEDNSNAKAKMQELLKNIPTSKLDESYSRYLPHVIGESIDSKTAITESKQTNKPKLNEGRVVTGNKDNQTNDVDVETALKRLRQLAGNN
jgi:hypothetical protein